MQRTEYDLKDAVMNDISFNVSSYSVGFGFGYQETGDALVKHGNQDAFHAPFAELQDVLAYFITEEGNEILAHGQFLFSVA